MYYIDTSVLVAYYCPEKLSDHAETIIRKGKTPSLSLLSEVEFSSALARKIREKELTVTDAMTVLALFQSHLSKTLFRQISLENQHYELAKAWINQFHTPLRTLDALHLAITHQQQLTLVTADSSFASAAKKLGIKYKLLKS